MYIFKVRKLISAVASKIGYPFHPAVGLAAIAGGITAMNQTEHDWIVLAGAIVGSKLFVLSKWFTGFCFSIVGGTHAPRISTESESSNESSPDPSTPAS